MIGTGEEKVVKQASIVSAFEQNEGETVKGETAYGEVWNDWLSE